jgi:hypothetical protein
MGNPPIEPPRKRFGEFQVPLKLLGTGVPFQRRGMASKPAMILV